MFENLLPDPPHFAQSNYFTQSIGTPENKLRAHKISLKKTFEMYKDKRLLTELYASSGKINVVQGSNFFMITADWNTFNLSYVSIKF